MGLLDQLLQGALTGGLGQATGQQRPAGQGGNLASLAMAVLPVVLGMLANRQGGAPGAGAGMGGIGDLLAQFQRAGFGEQARSWVGTGQNMPLSPDAMAQVFGSEGLSRIAAQAGLSEEQASAGLTEVLPEVVDKLTPQGEIPDGDAVAASISELQRSFFR